MIRALAFVAALNVCVGSSDVNETQVIKSFNEGKNLELVGDLISIVPKNSTVQNTYERFDAIYAYLRSHVIRIKVPFLRNKYFNFELKNLVPDDLAEGRKKKRMGIRDLLVPFLLAIKHKVTLLIITMMFVTILALKGFWAGITGLFISKLVALKVFLQSHNKNDENDEDGEETQEHSDYHEIPYHNTDEEETEEKEEPVVIYLNSDRHSRKFLRRQGQRLVRLYHNPKTWNPWERQQILKTAKWEKRSESWAEPTWD